MAEFGEEFAVFFRQQGVFGFLLGGHRFAEPLLLLLTEDVWPVCCERGLFGGAG